MHARTLRTLRFHAYGEPADVLRLERAEVPRPGPGRIRAVVHAMAVETAFRGLENLRVTAGQKVLIHGAGAMVGFAPVQIALQRGARVFATAAEGRFTVPIAKTFALEAWRQALDRSQSGHARGKLVLLGAPPRSSRCRPIRSRRRALRGSTGPSPPRRA